MLDEAAVDVNHNGQWNYPVPHPKHCHVRDNLGICWDNLG